MAFISNTGQASYKSDVQAVFETLQEQRSALLGMVRDTQMTTRLLVIDEARRLRSTAAPDDPRSARYLNGADDIARRVAALDVEIQIANIRVPPVTQTETLLQGRVTDEASNAASQVTVTLVDDQGQPVPGVAPVQTDDSGYYAFILQPEQVKAIGANRSLRLQLGRDSTQLVPASSQAFVLASGQVTVKEMPLRSDELDKLNLRPHITLEPNTAVDTTRVSGTVKARSKPAATSSTKSKKN